MPVATTLSTLPAITSYFVLDEVAVEWEARRHSTSTYQQRPGWYLAGIKVGGGRLAIRWIPQWHDPARKPTWRDILEVTRWPVSWIHQANSHPVMCIFAGSEYQADRIWHELRNEVAQSGH